MVRSISFDGLLVNARLGTNSVKFDLKYIFCKLFSSLRRPECVDISKCYIDISKLHRTWIIFQSENLSPRFFIIIKYLHLLREDILRTQQNVKW